MAIGSVRKLLTRLCTISCWSPYSANIDALGIGAELRPMMNPSYKRILVTGSSGYLGQHLLHSLIEDVKSYSGEQKEQIEIFAAYGFLSSFDDVDVMPASGEETQRVTLTKYGRVDLSNDEASSKLMESTRPSLVIHLAAMSSPGACEQDPDKAFAVNCPLNLLSQAPEGCSFIFLSTDQVYDGVNAPYRETDKTNPVNVYGQSKLAFEKALLASGARHRNRSACLRSSLILGPVAPLGECRKQSFLQFVYDRLSQKQMTNFWSDEFRSAVFVKDVVRVILWFVKNGPEKSPGVYNLGGPGRVSRTDIAVEVAERCGLDVSFARRVEKSSLPPGTVPSPPDISMDVGKLSDLTGIQMTDLAETVKESFEVD